MNKRNAFLVWFASLPILLFAIALRAAIWFVFVALVAAGIAWLVGSDSPRDAALFFGGLTVPFAAIWTLIIYVNALRNSN